MSDGFEVEHLNERLNEAEHRNHRKEEWFVFHISLAYHFQKTSQSIQGE